MNAVTVNFVAIGDAPPLQGMAERVKLAGGSLVHAGDTVIELSVIEKGTNGDSASVALSVISDSGDLIVIESTLRAFQAGLWAAIAGAETRGWL